MDRNPFDRILTSFRSAAAKYDAIDCALQAVRGGMKNVPGEMLGSIFIPGLPDYASESKAYNVYAQHNACDPKEWVECFRKLARKAGAALPLSIRRPLRRVAVTGSLEWWLAFLFWQNADEGRPRLFVSSPFVESADAIELCRLNSRRSYLPEPFAQACRHNGIRVSVMHTEEARQMRFVPRRTTVRPQSAGKAPADSKTDNRRKIFRHIPGNPAVVKLAKKIKRELPHGGTKKDIALDYTDGNEQLAKTLLRQLQPSRFGHLLD